MGKYGNLPIEELKVLGFTNAGRVYISSKYEIAIRSLGGDKWLIIDTTTTEDVIPNIITSFEDIEDFKLFLAALAGKRS